MSMMSFLVAVAAVAVVANYGGDSTIILENKDGATHRHNHCYAWHRDTILPPTDYDVVAAAMG